MKTIKNHYFSLLGKIGHLEKLNKYNYDLKRAAIIRRLRKELRHMEPLTAKDIGLGNNNEEVPAENPGFWKTTLKKPAVTFVIGIFIGMCTMVAIVAAAIGFGN